MPIKTVIGTLTIDWKNINGQKYGFYNDHQKARTYCTSLLDDYTVLLYPVHQYTVID